MTKNIKDLPPEIGERVAFWEIKSLKKHATSLGTDEAQKMFEKSLSKYIDEHFQYVGEKLPKKRKEVLMSIVKKLIPDYATGVEYDYRSRYPSPFFYIKVFLDGGNVDEWSKNATIVNLILENELKKFPGLYYTPIVDKEYQDHECKQFDGYPVTIRHYFWGKEEERKYVYVSIIFSDSSVLDKPAPEEAKATEIVSNLTVMTKDGEEVEFEI